jgi:hypothetical protein
MNTQYFRIIAIFISTVLFSCNDSLKPVENNYLKGKITGLNYKEVLIKIDSLTFSLEYYMSFDYFESEGEIVFMGYNFKTHSLDIINLSKRTVTNHIKLDLEGPDAIGREVEGLNIISGDSILIADQSKFAIVNKEGGIIWKLMKNDSRLNAKIPKGYFITRREAFKPGYDKKNISLIVYYRPFDDKKTLSMPIIAEISLDTPEVRFLPIHTSYFGSTVYKHYRPVYGGPQACFNEDKIIINYTFEPNIYVYDYSLDNVTVFGGKSKMTSNFQPDFDQHSNENDYVLSNINFFQFVYDPFKKLYYRSHWGEMKLKKSEFEFNTYLDKPVFLMVFDDSFNYLFETRLNIEYGIVPAHLFPTPEGLLIFPYKQNIDNLKNDQVVGLLINFK